ncbi:MAG: thiaminase II, partial [Duodenibacillus sp.]|nr:thiaminase II [Duodenibacillus sp.]
AYSAFEAQCAGMRPVAVAAAALMPCFWIYEQAGFAVAALRKTEGNPYAEWIAWYGSPDYSATVEEALAFADELAEASDPRTCEAMTEAFLRACRYEWMFFEAAWRKEAWPV